MDRKTIMKILCEFKSKVNKEVPDVSLIFFGSRARGKFHKDSDVDLIVVSKKFRKLNFFKRGKFMYKFWDYDLPVDFLCYTPEEFNKLKKEVSIVSEALREGIEV